MDTLNLHTLWRDLEGAIRTTLGTNEFAQGGVLIAALSALAVFARTLPGTLWARLKARFTLTVEVQGDDAAFPWLAAWLAAQPVGRSLRHLGVVTRYNETMGGHNLPLGTDRDGDEVSVRLVPLSGQVLLRYRGHWLLARPHRERREQGERFVGYSHSLTLRALGPSRAVLPALLREAYALTAGRADGQVELYAPNYDTWTLAERRPARPLDTLIYGEGVLESLLDDLTRFFADRDWYAGMGIPYRRGLLLYGPPGNGKSSLAGALAGHFSLSVCVLNLATPDLGDERLGSLLRALPRRALLLLEDIDAVFLGREPRTGSVKLSFNGLLNALDGVGAGEAGRVTVMTTNDRAGLDPALVRPGRADRHLLIDNATRAQVAAMLRRFWPQWDDIETLTGSVPGGTLSMARVQEYLLERRGDPDAVRRDWPTLTGVGCPTRLKLQSA